MDLMALGRFASAAGGRPDAGGRAQEPAHRPRRATTSSSLRRSARARCGRRCSERAAGDAGLSRGGARLRRMAWRAPTSCARSTSSPASSARRRRGAPARAAGAGGGRARSTSSSPRRWPTSAAQPPTLRGLPRLARARPRPRSSATPSTARDEVRVMTVHGAKGLEAPIVFLPDTCSTRSARRPGGLLRLEVATRPSGCRRRSCGQ